MSTNKVAGTVKWFSNKKGFGFISPTSDNSPTTDDIFVHQTGIFSDGAYRTLVEGSEVEFDVETEDENGKLKAVNVTAPGGGSLKPPTRERRPRQPRDESAGNSNEPEDENRNNGNHQQQQQKPKLDGGVNNNSNSKNSTPIKSGNDNKTTTSSNYRGGPKRDPPFHATLLPDIKTKLSDAGIELGQRTTVDVSIGEQRVKLGQGGYTSLASSDGMIGEGTYSCDQDGLVAFTWERCLKFVDGAWTTTDISGLMKTLSLVADGVGPVKSDESPEKLWGPDKTDPRDALEANDFKMRRVVLSRPPGYGRGPRRGGGGGERGGERRS